MTVLQSSFTGTTTGASVSMAVLPGKYYVSIDGTFSGTISLRRSGDGGTTWFIVTATDAFTAATWTGPGGGVGEEVELPTDTGLILYQFNCTVHASGTINYRLGQTIAS